jgi:hypothetical protein
MLLPKALIGSISIVAGLVLVRVAVHGDVYSRPGILSEQMWHGMPRGVKATVIIGCLLFLYGCVMLVFTLVNGLRRRRA